MTHHTITAMRDAFVAGGGFDGRYGNHHRGGAWVVALLLMREK